MTSVPNEPTLSRREAVKRIALLMGGALVGSQVLLRGQGVPDKNLPAFTDQDRALLDEIGETIIPGSKAAGIGAFMAMMVTDCYSPEEHAAFSKGMTVLDQARGRGFLTLAPQERTELLNEKDAEQRIQSGFHLKTPHYFKMMKQLAVLGYFSSEIGCTQSLRYIEVPGSFNGNYPYHKGDKAWFS